MIDNYNPNIINFIDYEIYGLNIVLVVFDERNSEALYNAVKIFYCPFFAYMAKKEESKKYFKKYHKEIYDYVENKHLDGAICIYYPALEFISNKTGYFAFLHEIGHIINCDNTINGEMDADRFAISHMRKRINFFKVMREIFDSTTVVEITFKEYLNNLKNLSYNNLECNMVYSNFLLRNNNVRKLNRIYCPTIFERIRDKLMEVKCEF